MGSSYLTSPLLLVINTLFDIYVLLVLLRFVLQWLRADFYNPVSQFIVRATAPPLKLLRRIIPSFAGQDMASLVLALLLLLVKYLLIRSLGAGIIEVVNMAAPIGSASIAGLIIIALAEVLATFINIFLFAIIIQVILSWVNTGGYNPVIGLIQTLSEPVMKPIRKFIPPLGGLDLTPLFASLGLMVVKMLIIPPIVFIALQL
ncbi:MAG: YggT family protein [Gammaproteobacteria bacterium]|nr:YggT family protein [Gammaproteobacteria bacterium]MBL7000351.1 YggT family protein [Gammaproteobacteria bacterium]